MKFGKKYAKKKDYIFDLYVLDNNEAELIIFNLL